MSATVIDLSEARLERSPRALGEANCMQCGHTWESVAPIGATWLQCPSCSSMKGHFKFEHQAGSAQFECYCGNSLFKISPEGPYCPNCGEWVAGA